MDGDGHSVHSIGVPKETLDGERRVVLDPFAVAGITRAGYRVLIEAGAGAGAGFEDSAYQDAGATIVPCASEAWGADLVVKVKQPEPQEYGYLRPGLALFGFLHLAAQPALARTLVDSGVQAYAFETFAEGGSLRLLAPMSEIAGRAAAVMAAAHLSAPFGGSGRLPGGAAGVSAARVVVLGLGVAGTAAARGLVGLDARVTGVDVNLDRMREGRWAGTVHDTLVSHEAALAEVLADADVVIGAALVPGTRAPIIVGADQVASMRPGSVIVDLAVDQGGCVETTKPTTLSDPVYAVDGVLHYCVSNVPGLYPHTASRALSAAVAPQVLRLARDPDDPALASAANVRDGRVVHRAVAEAVTIDQHDQEELHDLAR